jgi:hypothetical protein
MDPLAIEIHKLIQPVKAAAGGGSAANSCQLQENPGRLFGTSKVAMPGPQRSRSRSISTLSWPPSISIMVPLMKKARSDAR